MKKVFLDFAYNTTPCLKSVFKLKKVPVFFAAKFEKTKSVLTNERTVCLHVLAEKPLSGNTK